MPNWAAEAARFAPGLKVVTITDTLARSGAALAEVIAGADAVVTSYTLLRLDFGAHLAAEWSGLILDEAQYVKNHQSKIYQCARRLRAPFKVAITGTPMENNLMELWSLLSITAPGLFPNPARFREYYARPIETAGRRRAARPSCGAGSGRWSSAAPRSRWPPTCRKSRSRCSRWNCTRGTASSTRRTCSGSGRRSSG